MSKEEEQINISDFVVLKKDVFGALARYIQDQPYKEVVGLVQALGVTSDLEAFLKENKIK